MQRGILEHQSAAGEVENAELPGRPRPADDAGHRGRRAPTTCRSSSRPRASWPGCCRTPSSSSCPGPATCPPWSGRSRPPTWSGRRCWTDRPRTARPLQPDRRAVRRGQGAGGGEDRRGDLAAARRRRRRRRRVTCAGSAASSAYRFCTGSSSATTASVDRLLQRAVRRDAVGRAAAGGEDVEQVGHARLGRPVGPHRGRAGLGVGDRARHLAAYDVGRVEQEDRARRRRPTCTSCGSGSARSMTRAPAVGGRDDLGDREHLAVGAG